MALVGSLLFNLPVSAQEADAETPVVHAVFFYSPTCSHCHDAINNVLIPLMAEYGERLAVVGIDVSTEAGNYLYSSAILFYEVPENRRGVPTLVVADTVLVSSLEIENAFPQMVEAGLEAGGNEWPAFPGMAEVAASLTPTPESALPTTSPTPETAAVGIAEVETAVPPRPHLFPQIPPPNRWKPSTQRPCLKRQTRRRQTPLVLPWAGWCCWGCWSCCWW
ncbi:MAG: thioredoxin family protein [Chloroflexi bacterium]|nr:thioredoxin family protein [Chloroflexota bacterium]